MQQASVAPTPNSIDSIAGRDVRRHSAADHGVSRMTCLLNNAVFRTPRREPARGALRGLPPELSPIFGDGLIGQAAAVAS